MDLLTGVDSSNLVDSDTDTSGVVTGIATVTDTTDGHVELLDSGNGRIVKLF